MRNAAFEIARQSDAFAQSHLAEVTTALARPFRRLSDAWMLARLRRRLDRLDDRQLSDIGLARFEIDLIGRDGLGIDGAIDRLRGIDNRGKWVCSPSSHRRSGGLY